MADMWFNYKNGDYEEVEELPTSDEEARQYIAQYLAAQSLYGLYRARGKSILEAMELVLKDQVAAHYKQ